MTKFSPRDDNTRFYGTHRSGAESFLDGSGIQNFRSQIQLFDTVTDCVKGCENLRAFYLKFPNNFWDI